MKTWKYRALATAMLVVSTPMVAQDVPCETNCEGVPHCSNTTLSDEPTVYFVQWNSDVPPKQRACASTTKNIRVKCYNAQGTEISSVDVQYTPAPSCTGWS